MIKPLFVASCLLGMAGLHAASAQDVVEISPDETVLVERYVRVLPAPPPVIEEHMTLRPGSVIPEGVPLNRFTDEPKLERYAYFVSVDHKIVVADPRTRVVVRILDQKS
jgi:hypothetical protein